MSEDGFTIRLTSDQALVLSDWLDRMETNDEFDALVNEDRAVWSPILTISGTLATSLGEIFLPDYTARLDAARERLKDALGDLGRPPAPARDVRIPRPDQ
ncbi:hypothetical protein [Actinomadura sp. NPDC000929]|uniref:hypothetical protein n=1 Tax=Actinomadura sp. NPDC000929 TaxID=3154517 RepID=UPI00339A0A75